jgi:hypothetical protein
MARETKAERLAREAAERAAYEAEVAATYPERLMAMLERAQNVDFDLTVRNGLFVLVNHDAWRGEKVELSLEFSWDNENALDSLHRNVESKEAAREEVRRRAAMKETALSKLTAEERQVLGLE